MMFYISFNKPKKLEKVTVCGSNVTFYAAKNIIGAVSVSCHQNYCVSDPIENLVIQGFLPNF